MMIYGGQKSPVLPRAVTTLFAVGVPIGNLIKNGKEATVTLVFGQMWTILAIVLTPIKSSSIPTRENFPTTLRELQRMIDPIITGKSSE